MTTSTDLVLAVLSGVLAWRLWRAGQAAASGSLRLWSASLGCAALAAAVGGTRHGFAQTLSPTAQQTLWLATGYAIGLATFAMLAAAAVAATMGAARSMLIAAGGAKLLVYLGWITIHRDYLWAAVDGLVGSAVSLALLVREARRGRFAGLPKVLLGWSVGMGGAALRQTGFDPHPDFDHNALYHVVQMASLWWLYEGGLELRDRRNVPLSISVKVGT